ncbi:MAG: hypothetical protein LC772_11235, partial [Chloroflexi bacterium]|nr:hypothetical protein [Chloroflexota bacterium]
GLDPAVDGGLDAGFVIIAFSFLRGYRFTDRRYASPVNPPPGSLSALSPHLKALRHHRKDRRAR